MAIEIRGLAPLLQVFDMPASTHFYRDLLGFEVVQNSQRSNQTGDEFGWALLRRDGVELMLNTAYDDGERPSQPEPARVAAHADTILYFSCPDVDGACSSLRALGLSVEDPVVQSYGMKQLYLTDPDGYGICFQRPA